MTYKKITPIVAARKLVAILQLDKKEVSAIYIYAILAGLVQLVTPLGIQSIIGFRLLKKSNKRFIPETL